MRDSTTIGGFWMVVYKRFEVDLRLMLKRVVPILGPVRVVQLLLEFVAGDDILLVLDALAAEVLVVDEEPLSFVDIL